MDSWAGRSRQAVTVVGENAKSYAVASSGRLRLSGRSRYAAPGEIVLVPKWAVRFGSL